MKYFTVLCVIVLSLSVVTAISLPEPGFLSWPWGPQWEQCDFLASPGARCLDCHTKYVCTPVGGFNKTCKATEPWCGGDDGSCSETPSADCAPPEATTAAADATTVAAADELISSEHSEAPLEE